MLESVVEVLPSDVEAALSALDEADFERERCDALLLAALFWSDEDAGGGP